MNEGLDPSRYGIDIAKIAAMIKDQSNKPIDKRPNEKFTEDIKKKYQDFAKEHLGFEFNDVALFITALTHKSYVNEHRNIRVEHYERLEFLGDAILELVSSDFLYRNFHEQEGIMTAWRASLVRTESIGAASEEIGYVDLIRMSKGEKMAASTLHEKSIADCFEAVTGAVYLDKGYETAKELIYKYILPKMEQIIDNQTWRDPKSYLQELVQKTDGATPVYHTLKEEGPDHARQFTISVEVAGRVRGTGEGHNKQEAESKAAMEGIKYYKSLPKIVDNGKLSSRNL